MVLSFELLLFFVVSMLLFVPVLFDFLVLLSRRFAAFVRSFVFIVVVLYLLMFVCFLVGADVNVDVNRWMWCRTS